MYTCNQCSARTHNKQIDDMDQIRLHQVYNRLSFDRDLVSRSKLKTRQNCLKGADEKGHNRSLGNRCTFHLKCRFDLLVHKG